MRNESCGPFDTSGDGKCSNWASVNFLQKYQVAVNSTPLGHEVSRLGRIGACMAALHVLSRARWWSSAKGRISSQRRPPSCST